MWLFSNLFSQDLVDYASSEAFDGSLSWCVGGQVMGLWFCDLELDVVVAGFFCFFGGWNRALRSITWSCNVDLWICILRSFLGVQFSSCA
jgi:hypothetical protein